ncbi:Protein VAC14 -like protein [Sarcoptes scabiei]|uniref:Protein VAC14 homolog n=1 Tax=Sarcoptes scabiei TaxID=52283 RepID=A0A834VBT6_SARSC|nr:Protein VAC14 -like protein [Sarcoptes scabiei]
MGEPSFQLPQVCIRLLNDKLFEKKKIACKEIEILTKDLNSRNQANHIKELIEYFHKNFIENSSPNSKIGGLLAIASVAVALDQDSKFYLQEICRSIFLCTNDYQRDVRYRALESLYNVAKCARSNILVFLSEIFDIVVRSGEDSDQSIREASLLMDKLMKDIVIECTDFDIVNFIGLIRERIYALSPNTRKLILSWIDFLDSLPEIDLLVYIEDILDGLLKIACDSNLDIQRTAETILSELFEKLKMNPKCFDSKPLVKILLIHIQTDDHLVKNISLKWLDQFVRTIDERDILPNTAHILSVILTCFSSDNQMGNDNLDDCAEIEDFRHKNMILAKSIIENLMNLITKKPTRIETDIITDDKVVQEKISKSPTQEKDEDDLKISKILIVLLNHLEMGETISSPSKIAILEWIHKIYINLNNIAKIKIDPLIENKLNEILLHTLKDQCDDVVQLDLKVFTEINIDRRRRQEDYRYKDVIESLLQFFAKKLDQLRERMPFIIINLCRTIDSKIVYLTMSRNLLRYDIQFICFMVYTMNTILLTSNHLHALRNELRKDSSCEKESDISSHLEQNLFDIMYTAWCYSSVSVISLCFLTKRYRLASKLILLFGDIDITLDLLIEIDKLIQMLESPIFTSLRLDLLNPNGNHFLRKSLYGLLMVLPQSETFHLLRKRLQCISNLNVWEYDEEKDDRKFQHGLPNRLNQSKSSSSSQSEKAKQEDLERKIDYYIEIQDYLKSERQSSSTII